MDKALEDALTAAVQDSRIGDILLAPAERLRYFVHNDLVTDPSVAVSPDDFETILTQLHVDRAQKDEDRRWDFADHNLRGNLCTSRGKAQLCFRVLRSNPPLFNDCDFPESQALRELVLGTSPGLLLVAGRPYAGKSMTCSAIVHEFALLHRRHILTFEHPIELLFPKDLPSLVTQRDLVEDMDNSLKALESVVRQRPGMIFVQEIRDPQTAFLVLALASSGNRVLATLHAKDAPSAITSFLKWLPSDRWAWGCYMMSQFLICDIAQRLEAAVDDSRRLYVLHEVLATDHTTSAIISQAAKDEDRLRALPGLIRNGGESSTNISWATSLERWQDKGIQFSPELIDELNR